MQVFVRSKVGTVTNFDLEENDTVDSLKARIQENCGVPVDQQLLFFDRQKLEEGQRALSSYNVQNKSTLVMLAEQPLAAAMHMARRPSITIKTLKGTTTSVAVEAADTVADLKHKIHMASSDHPEPDQQRLIFNGQQLDDMKSLTDLVGELPWETPPVIFLVPRLKAHPIKIVVKTLASVSFTLEMDSKDTVDDLKLKIEAQQGTPPETQRIVFAGKQLSEGTKTLDDYGVKDESTIHIVLRRTGASGALSSHQPVLGSCDSAGACGLFNLGNTCFMNAVLQALSNTVPLREYYRSGTFKGEISDAPLSMKGRLATTFAELLAKMWQDDHTVLAPSDLKQLIAEKRPEFAGYQQHDAQEVLTFLLDGLHEDVNKAPYPRPIVEDPSTDGKTDFQIACEAWSGNLRRNDSRIVDIFQFQIRSEIIFPEAQDKSLKFDPMMYLSLPVPKPPNTVNITVVRSRYPQVAPTKHCIEIAKDRTFSDLQAKLFDELRCECEENEPATSSSSSSSSSVCLAFANMWEGRVLKFFGPSQKVGEVRHYDTIWAFEVPLPVGLQESDVEFIVAQLRKTTQAVSSVNTCEMRSFSQFAPPHIVAVRRSVDVDATELCGRLLAAANRLQEYLGVESDDCKVSVTVLQNGPEEGQHLDEENTKVLRGSKLAVNFFDLDSALQGRPLALPETRSAASARNLQEFEREVDLEQCLDAFTLLEELGQEDWVKCNKTGDFERSLKKLDLWTAPDCLLVHLKRFGSEVMGGPLEKVETPVKAPMDLDLTPWLRGPAMEGGAHYKLYAVVNHSGSLSYGHYTAYCRVGEGCDRRWYHFNDSTVERADESQVVSKAAYILFYERIRQPPPQALNAKAPT